MPFQAWTRESCDTICPPWTSERIELLVRDRQTDWTKRILHVKVFKNYVMDIVFPFIYVLSNIFVNLSPVEIQICNLIKNCFSSKEIAKIRSISCYTVSRHREHIRERLNLSHKKINPMSYPNSLRTQWIRHLTTTRCISKDPLYSEDS